MSQTRATLHTVKSIKALSKVCRDSLDSPLKTLPFIKNFSTLLNTAADDSLDFQSPSGFSRENYLEHPHNPSGVFNGQNPDGVYGENSSGVVQNPGVVFGQQNHRTKYPQNVAGQTGNYSNQGGGYRSQFQDYPVRHDGDSKGYYGNNSNYVEDSRIGFQHNATGQKNGNFTGYYGNNIGANNLSGFNMESSRNVQQSSNALSGANKELQGDWYGGNNAAYQQNASRLSEESIGSGNGFPGERIGQHQQNVNGVYNSNSGTNQGNFSGNYTGTYQHSSLNNSYGGMVGAQMSTNYQAAEESVEVADGSQLRGTIEELDGFCKEGKLKEAVEVLGLLEQQHIPVDMPRYLLLMKECGEYKALQEAKYVHEHLVRSFSHLEISTYNKILEMYMTCGSVDEAFTIFQSMPQRNLTTWDTMITWLAKNGHGEDAIDMFTEFKKIGLRPDSQMFFGVFSACSVLGDMDEGLLHFETMSKDFGIVPSIEHYVGVVNMLGSTGYLDEALEFVEKMPIEPSVSVWETLMNLCRVHGNTELGDRCAELVELLDPSRLDEQLKSGLISVKASDLAKEKEKKKLSGQNPLEFKSRVHEYRAGDTSHPDNDKIYALLRGMRQQMKEAGYVAETKFVLHDIDQEGKEEALLAHSERLAVAQGLMSSPARSPMRIIKNLRVCGDCHNALKIISKLVGRELIIRDAKRFHHFKDGLCSCRDYW